MATSREPESRDFHFGRLSQSEKSKSTPKEASIIESNTNPTTGVAEKHSKVGKFTLIIAISCLAIGLVAGLYIGKLIYDRLHQEYSREEAALNDALAEIHAKTTTTEKSEASLRSTLDAISRAIGAPVLDETKIEGQVKAALVQRNSAQQKLSSDLETAKSQLQAIASALGEPGSDAEKLPEIASNLKSRADSVPKEDDGSNATSQIEAINKILASTDTSDRRSMQKAIAAIKAKMGSQ